MKLIKTFWIKCRSCRKYYTITAMGKQQSICPHCLKLNLK